MLHYEPRISALAQTDPPTKNSENRSERMSDLRRDIFSILLAYIADVKLFDGKD